MSGYPNNLRKARSPSRAFGLALTLAASFIAPSTVGADKPSAESVSSPGLAANGLDGFGRVGFAGFAARHLSLAGTAGFGYTEKQGEADGGSHTRLSGLLAFGAQPLEWLAFALEGEGRMDFHPSDDLGSDDGKSGLPRLTARASYSISQAFGLALETQLSLPGGTAPSVGVDALAVDLAALASFAATQDLVLGFKTGFRYDNSKNAIDNPDALRRGDRIALGASDFNALLLGLAASYRFAPFTVLSELTFDWLLGSNAPSALESPLRFAAAFRYDLLRSLQLEARVEAIVGSRAPSTTADPLVPIEPRVSTLLGIRYTLPVWQPEAEAKPAKKLAKAEEKTPEPVAPSEPQPGSLSLTLASAEGAAIAGAAIRLSPSLNAEPSADDTPSEASAPEAEPGDELAVTETAEADDGPDGESAAFTGVTDDTGALVLEALPPGEYMLLIEAEGFEPFSQRVTVGDGQALNLSPALEVAIPRGQLRCAVQSFNGIPIKATIRIEPSEQETQADEDGTARIDLEPGNYVVYITATGYREQRRRIRIQENGVTILNIDMRAKRRRKRRR